MSEIGTAILAIDVGNTRTTFANFRDWRRETFGAAPNEPFAELAERLGAAAEELGPAMRTAVVIASVNHAVADRLAGSLASRLGARPDGPEVLRVGADLLPPIRTCLDPQGRATVGQDRLLSALAAWEAVQQACVVIDAGTAVTVDFVDGEGVFHGGAIAPGAAMMLRSMHEHTSALPSLSFERPLAAEGPEADPFGRNTRQAMLNGVFYGIRGMVRSLVERYAEAYQAYPQVVATGGDAEALFADDDLVEHVTPDLTVRGIAAACRILWEGTDGGPALGECDHKHEGCCGEHHRHDRQHRHRQA